MKINFTCPNCQRVLQVAGEHVGKKAKCPACDTISLIKADSETVIPVVQPMRPSPTSTSLFDSESDPFGDTGTRANPQANTNPYQPLAPLNQRRPARFDHHGGGPTDVQGILSIVFGGLSLLSLMLCMCAAPLALIALTLSIAGLVLSFFAQPPLKLIGTILNSIVLGICLLFITLAIVVWILAVTGAFNPGNGRGF